jgi:hypothetical protein
MAWTDLAPFLKIGGGLALLAVGVAWLHKELFGEDGESLLDVMVSGMPSPGVALALIGYGGWLVYTGCASFV